MLKGDEVTGTPSSVHEQLLAVHAADIVIQGEGVGGGVVVLEIATALVGSGCAQGFGAGVVTALVVGVLDIPDVVLDVLCTPGHTCQV